MLIYICNTLQNPAVPVKDVAGNFENFGLDKRILQFLQKEGVDKPTNIQVMLFYL